jgi:hypothetical protein
VACIDSIYSRASLATVRMSEVRCGCDLAIEVVEYSGRDMNLHFDRLLSQYLAVDGIDSEPEKTDHLTSSTYIKEGVYGPFKSLSSFDAR